MESVGRPLKPWSSQYQRLRRSESLDHLLGSAVWANEIEPAARESPPHQQQQQQPQAQAQGRGRLLRSRSLPDLLGLRRRAIHWKALSWFLDPGSRRKVGSLEYLKQNRGDAVASSGQQQAGGRMSGTTTTSSRSREGGGGGGDEKHRRKDRRQKQQQRKKRSSWLPDPDRRWPIQGW